MNSKKTRITKVISILLAASILSACGGGGGSSSSSNSASGSGTGSSPTSSNPRLVSANPNPTVSNIKDFPVNGYNLSNQTFTFGHFGSTTANCFLTVGITRGKSSESNASLPDSPAYIFCQQPNGAFAEVSVQLIGKQLNVNNGYPLVADFNGDGIDDAFLIQMWDGFASDGSYDIKKIDLLISKSNGTYDLKEVPVSGLGGMGNQSASIDVNGDGCLDVATGPNIFLGDCKGSFDFRANPNLPGSINMLTFAPQSGMSGFVWSGVGTCSGDLNGDGKAELVLTSSKIPDLYNSIYEINDRLQVTAVHKLPPAYFNTLYPTFNSQYNVETTATDSFRCDVVDINNDGKKDVLISTTNFFATQADEKTPPLSYVQVYLNQGNFNFVDISSTALQNYDKSVSGSSSPRFVDLNHDGYLDIALDGGIWLGGAARSGNQVYINNKNNTFSPVFTDELIKIYDQYAATVGGSLPNSYLSMLPIYNGSSWSYVVEAIDKDWNVHVGVANTNYIFK